MAQAEGAFVEIIGRSLILRSVQRNAAKRIMDFYHIRIPSGINFPCTGSCEKYRLLATNLMTPFLRTPWISNPYSQGTGGKKDPSVRSSGTDHPVAVRNETHSPPFLETWSQGRYDPFRLLLLARQDYDSIFFLQRVVIGQSFAARPKPTCMLYECIPANAGGPAQFEQIPKRLLIHDDFDSFHCN